MSKTPRHLTFICTKASELGFSRLGSDRLTSEEREHLQQQVKVYLEAYVRDGPFDESLEFQIQHMACDRQNLPTAVVNDPQFLRWWAGLLQKALACESMHVQIRVFKVLRLTIRPS